MGNNIDKMDELKQSFQLLTQKLESQLINNERLLRTVIKGKMNWIHQYVYFELFIVFPLASLCWLGLYFMKMISLPLAVASLLIMFVDVMIDIYINRVVGKGWLENDLLASRTILLEMKQTRSKQMLYSIPLLIVWLVVFAIDLYTHLIGMNQILGISMIVGGVVGGIVGFGLAFSVYKKMQRTNDEIIGEIDRFKEE